MIDRAGTVWCDFKNCNDSAEGDKSGEWSWWAFPYLGERMVLNFCVEHARTAQDVLGLLKTRRLEIDRSKNGEPR